MRCSLPTDLVVRISQAAQKLLVKRDGANWEDLMINMQMVELDDDDPTSKKRRGLITSIYKQGTP